MASKLLQTRKAQYAIGIAIWLFIVALGVLFSWAPPRLIAIVDIVVLAALIVLMDGGGSFYKLALWFRHRKQPEKRELIAFSNQIYPRRLRKFLMDEEDEQESDPSVSRSGGKEGSLNEHTRV